MRQRYERPRCWMFVLASVLLHLARLGSLHPPRPAARSAPPSIIELSIVSSMGQPSKRAPRDAATGPSRGVTHFTARPAEATERAHTIRDLLPRTIGQEPQTSVSTGPLLTTGRPEPTTLVDLTPRGVASAALASSVFGCESGLSATAEDCARAAEHASPQLMLTQSLQESARSQPYLSARRAPSLQREAAGGYRYQGRSISAHIAQDGSVAFTDYDPGRKHPRRAQARDVAEKRWFLEQTEAQRMQLADAARAGLRAHARRALELELERILNQPDADAGAKHQRILVLWEEAGTDDDAQRARQILVRFVREHMPEHGPLGFSRTELDAFNRARAGGPPFDPYPAAALPAALAQSL